MLFPDFYPSQSLVLIVMQLTRMTDPLLKKLKRYSDSQQSSDKVFISSFTYH